MKNTLPLLIGEFENHVIDINVSFFMALRALRAT